MGEKEKNGSNGERKYISESDIKYYRGLVSRCEEIQEVMGRTPQKVMNHGKRILIFVTVTILMILFFIKMPQNMGITLYKSTPGSFDIPALTEGEISHLYVNNGKKVKAGDTIAIVSFHEKYSSIIAIHDGDISFPAPRNEGAIFKKGDILFSIRLENDTCPNYYGYVTSENISKLSVNEKFENSSYGPGRITSISPLPNKDGNHLVEVSFSEMTNHPARIEADIAISETSLFSILAQGLFRH